MADPAPALGANDAPWLARLRRLASMPNLPGGHPLAVSHADLTAAVEAFDGQAAQLAAVEPIVAALAFWPLGCPEFVVALRDLKALVGAGAVGEGRDGG